MENTQRRIQFILNRHFIVVSVIICGITLLISSICSWDDNAVMGVDKLFGDGVITVVCILCMYGLGLNVAHIFQRKNFMKGLLLGIPFYIIGIASVFISNSSISFHQLHIKSGSEILLFLVNMLFVGINEEVLMRGLILNYLRNNYGETKKGIRKAIIVSAAIFGMIHLPNVFFFDSVTVIVQAVNAASAGVLFAVIYVISKNLWATIIVHAIVDTLSLFISQCFSNGQSVLTMNMTIPQALAMVTAGSVPPILIAVCYMKKSFNKKKL